MLNNTFCQPISVDSVPQGRLCEWCNKPAVHQLTAIGGPMHNQGGYFCHGCGEEFTQAVTRSKTGASSPPKDSRTFSVLEILVHVHAMQHCTTERTSV